MKNLPPIKIYQVLLGCDPEFFFERDGKIIGSENVIDLNNGLAINSQSKFIVDGVQAELNPQPFTCREQLANEISACFRHLHEKVKNDPTLKVNFKPTVTVTKSELKKLDKKSRVFGCAPSKSVTNKKSKITINANKYLHRSAGGHIHLGKCPRESYSEDRTAYIELPTPEFDDPEKLVNVLDILVGNTCVLLDRDPGNKIRRKVYGKAGEYRTPEHGVEYRTLSNFWLRSYPLMGLVMGLSRQAAAILQNTTPKTDYYTELMNCVDMVLIRRAINTNNAKLAAANYQQIKPFLAKYFTTSVIGQYYPTLYAGNLDHFDHFVSKGIDYWFPEDALTHWVNLGRASSNGFENFLTNQVGKDMRKALNTPVKVTGLTAPTPTAL